MNETSTRAVTILLREWRQGDEAALSTVAELVNRELHRLAASYLRRDRPGHTLQPTALVNAAYVRLMGQAGEQEFDSRSHFISIAACHMRHILVDYARRPLAAKRGGGATVVSLEDARVASDPAVARLSARRRTREVGAAWLRSALSAPAAI
jgi:RNA polymerase sigma-70 factor (ECF subfamily)